MQTGRKVLLMGAMISATAWTLGACASSSNPVKDDDPSPPTDTAASANVARTIFVLERQISLDNFAKDVNALYADGTYSTLGSAFPSVDTIAGKYGASSTTSKAVTDWLTKQGATDVYVDVTQTFVSAMLTPAQVKAIWDADYETWTTNSQGQNVSTPGGAWGSIVQEVPPGLSGDVTAVYGAFDAWWNYGNAPASNAEYFPDDSPAVCSGQETPQQDQCWDPADWPAYALGSGTAETCPTSGGCLSQWPTPNDVDVTGYYPSQLRTAYGVPSDLDGTGLTAVVLEWGGYVYQSDISTYATGVAPTWDGTLLQLELDDANASSSQGGAEATLDVTTLIGLAPGLDQITLINAPVPSNAAFVVYMPMLFADALDATKQGLTKAPDVVSVSYGLCEPTIQAMNAHNASWLTRKGGDSLPGVFPSVQAAMEPIFLTAAAAGVSIAVAAGDSGSTGCARRQPTWGADGKPTYGSGGGAAVSYPSSSPWVTAVGGTNLQLDDTDNSIVTAGVWNDTNLGLAQWLPASAMQTEQTEQGQTIDVWIWSCMNTYDQPLCAAFAAAGGGGGNSTVFPQASWQSGVSGTGSGRAVPDIAFLADTYPGTVQYQGDSQSKTFPNNYTDSSWKATGNGTSQATPIFSALTALLNQKASKVATANFNKNKPASEHKTLHWRYGLMAPVLYNTLGGTSAVRDITSSDTPNSNNVGGNVNLFSAGCCTAATGYDRASGWGSLLLGETITTLGF